MKEIQRVMHHLLGLHKATRDRRYLQGARMLAGPPITDGRNRIHDERHLLRMTWLLHEGHASSPWSAAGIVAGEIEGHSFDAAQRRLYRKFQTRKAFYTYVGPSLWPHIEYFEDGVTNAHPT